MESAQRILMVSNRLPFQVVKDGRSGKPRLEAAPGGLVAALDPVLRRSGGIWFGWPGSGGPKSIARAASDLPYEIVPVALSKDDLAGYYDGFSNRTLWPLCHDLLGRTAFHEEWWTRYVEVNARFAQAVAERLRPGDFVWAHDFHLLLFGRALRKLRPGVLVGLFLHVPFPQQGLFHRLPWRREIAESLLEYDLVGFQAARDLRSFSRTMREVGREAKPLETGDRDASFEWRDRVAYAAVFPISIDYAQWDRLGRDKDVVARAARFRRRNGDRKIVIGVDRLDYSKGIPQRLRAFAELLERHPEEHEKVQFVQIAVPSRTSVGEYRELKREIDRLIGHINGRFATPGWVPVNYINRSFGSRDLAAYYRAADVALVTPIKDGMNLVAKEFCAASVAGRGVLVLSEFAGASAELASGALVVNPHDTKGIADAVHRGLHMPAEEQRKRLEKLRKTIESNDVHHWAESFVAAARSGSVRLREPESILAEWPGFRAERLLLSLDYDGTLVPIRPLPGMATPTREIVALLDALSALPGVTLLVMSGRALGELDVWFPNPEIVLVGGHGASWRRAGTSDLLLAPKWLFEVLSRCRERLAPLLESAPGSLLEDKGTSIALHYRLVEGPARRRLLAALRSELKQIVSEHAGLELLEGRAVLELRLAGVDKGAAFEHVRKELALDAAAALVIGDDHTDEDAFDVLGESDLALHVGVRPTKARFALKDVGTVGELLRAFARVRGGTAAAEPVAASGRRA